MEVEYGSNKLKKQLSNASEIKRAFGTNAKRISIRLDDIKASPNLAILKQIPGANCHSLSGNREGEWAVDISANYRLIFGIALSQVPLLEDGGVDATKVTDILIIKIEDYH